MQNTDSRRIGSFVHTDGKRLHVRALFEDDDILAINKPAGLLSLPDRYDRNIPHVMSVLHSEEYFIVHRLDRDTSGIMLLAKSADAHAALNAQFESRRVDKSYATLVVGAPPDDHFVIDKPLLVGAGPGHRTLVEERGKPAQTEFSVLERYRGYTLLRAFPRTGRTHQIRAHLAFAGYPVLADRLYGDGKPLYLSAFKARYSGNEDDEERPLIGRHALHASSIGFVHPATNLDTTIEAPMSKDMKAATNQLGKWARRS